MYIGVLSVLPPEILNGLRAGVHTGGGGGGGETWDIPPSQEFSQPNFNISPECSLHNFRMAISTSRMPQNQCQSFYFPKPFWGRGGGGVGHAPRPS